MKKQPGRLDPLPPRTLADRAIGVAFIGFLLWLAYLQFTGQLGDRWDGFVLWLGQFFG
jgi:hypothetical protein